jgi:hypothetical protein
MAGKPRIAPLNSALDCRRELARVYRMARRGELETHDLTRYAHTLQIMVGMIRDSDMEKRISVLEDMAR